MDRDPLKYHQRLKGKIVTSSKEKLTCDNLPLAYTPGVAKASLAISQDKEKINELTGKKNTVAIITDGTAVLGLGNIGPEAALPVMEGKAAIFSDFAGINAVPLCLDTTDTEEIISIVKAISPGLGGINLEDISAPRCFEIERRLSSDLNIPVFHDDQHGTAIVVLAGLINALKVVGKKKEDIKVVISGAGAAGIAIAEILCEWGVCNYCLCDSRGIVSGERKDINEYKKEAVQQSTASCPFGNCPRAAIGADVLIGVSGPDSFKKEDVRAMAPNPIVFALANPVPEIMPEAAKAGGAAIVATGRSDFPNQINNALVFPGLFRGLLDNNIIEISSRLKIAVAEAIAGVVKKPTPENIIPSVFDKKVVKVISDAVKNFR